MLIGRGALANHHDLPAAAREEFEHWHTTEHLPERVGVPGFLRGRRCRALDPGASPGYFILYETTDLEVLRSPAYVGCLDAPTPWTARVSATMTRTLRTAARVHASAGRGAGGTVLTARLEAPPEAPQALPAALGRDAMAALASRPGVCGAHALEGDAGVTGVDTRERTMRHPPDEFVPWTVVVEGTSREALEGAWRALRASLPQAAAHEAKVDVHALQCLLALCDL
jgi:hypothetical protein